MQACRPDPVDLEPTLYGVIQLVIIHYGGIWPGKRRYGVIQLVIIHYGGIWPGKRRRRKLQVVISHTWAMIMSQFQRLFPRFRGWPVEWRHYQHRLPLAHMGNLVCLEWWSNETGTCDISLVDCDIFTIPRKFLICFHGSWIELRHWQYGLPLADMENFCNGSGVEENWILARLPMSANRSA